MEEISVNGNTRLQPTHYFDYKGKKYPFNMKLFKCYSKYFQMNKNLYKNITDITIFNDFEDINLTEGIIEDFINFCQSKNITLNKENSPPLHRLAKKFIVPLLIDSTNEFIQSHQKEVVVELLLLNQRDNHFDTTEYEKIISNDLPYYINDNKLLLLPNPILYRIMTKYHQKNSNNQINDQSNTDIVEFLFKCLDKYGREASILFDQIDLCNSKNNALNRLLFEYSDKFDFHFINTQLLKTVYQLESEMIEKVEKVTNANLTHKNEIESLIQKHEEKDDQIQQKQKEIENLVKKQQEKNNEYDRKIESLIQKQEEINKEKNDQIQQKQKEIENLVKQQQEKNNEYDRKIESLIQKQDEKIQQIQLDFKKQLSDLNETVKNLSEKVTQLNELNQKPKEIKSPTPSVSCRFKNVSDPSGIISILGETVSISCGKNNDQNYPLSNIRENDNSSFINSNPSFAGYETDTYIIFDFGSTRKIDLYSYFIHAVSFYSKTWKIEGSNDQSQWTPLDIRVDDPQLKNDSKHQCHFVCQKAKHGSERYRFIRFSQQDSWDSGAPYEVYLYYFELYGDVFN